ncbi:MAG: CotH kinase family protein [Bacilli bacterium]|nr:CotH kinase family protein [Bacilli bacterium]
MIKFDKVKFKENSKYILIILLVLNLLLLVTTIVNRKTSVSVIENDIEESGDSTINKLVINEMSNNNDGSYAADNGKIYDWIELYNGTDKDIDLNGYSLSDDDSKIKWTFSDTIIKSKEYLVVFLAGENIDGLYANFALSKNGGEVVVLKNRSGKVVDIVESVKTNKNTSLARTLDGEWQVVKQITPGYVNTKDGYIEYIKSLENLSNDIIINEVLVRNGGQFTDDYSEYSGYIELKNTTDSKIELKDYSLSDSLTEPFKWQLPDISLKSGEIIMIYTSGRDIDSGILHTNFKLNSKNGNVILSKNGVIVGNLEYANVANGYALSYVDGNYQKTSALSGGYENTSAGVDEFSKHNEKIKDSLIINEVMNNNYEYLPQNSGNYYDWIELKNNTSEVMNLGEYYLTTTLNDPEMYNLPNVELKPGEYYIIMASGDTNLSNSSYNHANFKVSNVESIYITSNNKVIDGIFIANVPNGYSYGRDNSYGFIYMEKPTPGANNNYGLREVAFLPTYSIESGIYNDVENVVVEINSPGTIYYTLNGDNPTTRSNVYTGPITLNKTSVVKAISVEDSKYNSEVANASYIINENHTLPVLSLAIDNSNYKAVVNNVWGSTEKEAYAAFFYEDENFEIPCGLQLFGGSTRALPKQSFSLKFKKMYGEGELHYQVFDNRDNSVYNTLVLRSGSQDYNVSMMRDPVLTSIMEDTSVDVQAMRPVILYINGSYWGIYFLDEKVDEDFISAHYNVGEEGTNIVRVDGNVSVGSGASYEELLTYMKTHNMASSEAYEYVKERIDIDNLIEFWIAETYLTNNDIINCRVFSNPNIDGGKWNFIFYDLDFAMYYPSVNYYNIMNDPSGMGSMQIRSDLTLNLFKNSEFRNRFVEKLSEMLKNEWSEENVISKIDEYYDLLKPEMARNVARWGSSMTAWEREVENLRNFARKRKNYLLSQTKSYFKLSDEEMSVFYE